MDQSWFKEAIDAAAKGFPRAHHGYSSDVFAFHYCFSFLLLLSTDTAGTKYETKAPLVHPTKP